MNSSISINGLPINNNEKSTPLNIEKHLHRITSDDKLDHINNPPRKVAKIEDTTRTKQSRETVGGKGSALYRMQQTGMNVPEFTTIDVNTTENLEQHVLDINSLKPFISDVASFDLSVVNIANIKQYIQNKYSNQPEQRNLYLQGLAKFIASDACYQQISNSQSAKLIRENYQQLITSLPEDSAIIVRSSGIKEDNYGDAQAGKFESIVHGKQNILQTCLQVLASGFQPHVCPYSAPQPMALILQRCIDCSFGGVAMSRTSLTDHRGKIEFVPGQPKGGVSGLAGVTPHCYLVSQQNDEFIAEFTEGNVATQFILKQQDNNNFEEKPVALTENTNANLTEEQLKQIYQYIKQGEDILLCPADIEFAIAKDGTVYIVQLRPLTVLTGGMDFATEIPTNPLATGTLVSEGVCSGKLFYVKNQQDAATIPQGAIIVAEHGEDWMLETSFLQKVGGFIFQQGGTNDHVAITLRQQELPCLIILDDFAKFKINNEIVTMACCSFNDTAGAYVVSGSEFADKLATMQSTVRSTYKPRSSETPVIKTPELSFNKPDIAFKNLHDLNYKLLDYFSADSWLTRCFTEKGMLLLAMAPHRIEIIKEATQEIQQMFADFEIFVSGYKQYLQLGIKPKTSCKELQHKLIEAEKLSVKFNNIKTRVNNNLDNILQQFTNVADQTINKADFNQILQDATNIFADTQQLNIPQNIDEVNSLHDCIFRMHKEFIEALAAIAINSNLGIITRHKNIDTIVFSNTQEQQEIKELCVAELCKLFSRNSPKIIILENTIIVTAQLGNHSCTIEMLEDAEAGKGRTLKLKLSDDFTEEKHVQGKLKRFWFLAQMLHNIGLDENASGIKASVEESTEILSIEISHIKTKKKMLNKFKTLILVLNSMRNIDLHLNEIFINKNHIDWNFSTLKQYMVNLSLKRNQQCFNHAIIILGNIFLLNDEYKQFSYAKNNKFYHLFHLIKNITTENEIPKLFNNINNIDEDVLLYNLLTVNMSLFLKKKLIPLINYVKKSRPELFMNEKNILELCSHNGILLEYLDSNFQKNKSVVLQAMIQNIYSLQYADKELTNDDEFMITCIKYNSWALNYASDNLKKDKDIVLAAVSKIGSSLQYASDNLQNDKDIVLAAVSKIGSSLQYASDNLKNDKDIVLVAVSNTGGALRYASDNLKNDKDIVLATINDNATALEYASDELKNNKDIVLAAVNKIGSSLQYASDNLKNDKDVVSAAISTNYDTLEYASDELKSNKEFMLKAIIINSKAYYHVNKSLKHDKQIIQAYKEASKK